MSELQPPPNAAVIVVEPDGADDPSIGPKVVGSLVGAWNGSMAAPDPDGATPASHSPNSGSAGQRSGSVPRGPVIALRLRLGT